MLRLPSEPADSPFAAVDVDDHRGAAADAVAVAIVRVLERSKRFVGDGLDQSCSEERNGHAPREYIRVWRQYRLTPMARHGEHMKERIARGVQSFELAVRVPAPCPQLGHRPCAADRGD